uniref:Distal membrane arm assembly component 2 n=1 Tax=Sphenodon punctatus TaxID=8508 RepID=A0A8D0HAM6_SPHPU
RIVKYLSDRFYDVEALLISRNQKKYKNLQKQNADYKLANELDSDSVAAACFVLIHQGGVRYQGHTDWYRESKPWKIRSKDLPVEAVDVSGSVINYDGLDNLVRLSALKSLNLSHCPHIDDWSLSRLHAFRETLEDLSLAGCPQVTERGLATLHHLQ